MPFFSVVIPTYNRAALVLAAVASVLAQDTADLEVIVVDDGSTDATIAELAAVARRDPRVRVFEQPNRGPGPARNRGVAEAAGDYVAFLDSDDLLLPWALSTYRAAVERFGRPAMLFGSLVKFDAEDELRAVRREPDDARAFDTYLAACDHANNGGDHILRATCVLCVRTDAVRAVGGFVERDIYCEDLDLMFRLNVHPGVVQVRKPTLVALRQHPDGSLGNLDRSTRGIEYMVEQERQGRYPGGDATRALRREIIAHQARFISLIAADRGRMGLALRLWRKAFAWHWQLGSWRYLAALPLLRLAPRLNPLRGYKH